MKVEHYIWSVSMYQFSLHEGLSPVDSHLGIIESEKSPKDGDEVKLPDGGKALINYWYSGFGPDPNKRPPVIVFVRRLKEGGK